MVVLEPVNRKNMFVPVVLAKEVLQSTCPCE